MSSCSCIDIDHDNGPVAFSANERTAKVKHKCYECNRTIHPGEKYAYESGVWDGKGRAYKTCSDCISLRKAYFCGYTYGNLWENFTEWVAEGGIDSLEYFHKDLRHENLTPRARQMAFSIVDKYMEDYLDENPFRLALRTKEHKFYWKAWTSPLKQHLELLEDACREEQAEAEERLAQRILS